MKKLLLICNTPYQIIVAAQTTFCYFEDFQVDVIISDEMSNSMHLYENIKKSGMHNNVFFIKSKGISKGRKKEIINYFLSLFNPVKFWDKYLKLNSTYQCILFSNISLTTQYLLRAVKRKNKNIKVFMYEDGASTYSNYYGNFYNRSKWYRRLISSELLNIDGIYAFNPEQFVWTPPCEIYPIMTNIEENFKILEYLNKIFEYNLCTDNYNKRFVFFEESYYSDCIDIGDFEFIENLSRIIGKDNIFIKIHPRSPVNRFACCGYMTNTNFFTPWELFVLNQKFENTIFITISSGAALNPYFVFGKEIRAVFLFDCIPKKSMLRNDIVELINKQCMERSDLFFVPNSQNKFIELIKSLL